MTHCPDPLSPARLAHGSDPPPLARWLMVISSVNRTDTSENITLPRTTYVFGKDELTLLAVNITSNESSSKGTGRADGCDSLSV